MLRFSHQTLFFSTLLTSAENYVRINGQLNTREGVVSALSCVASQHTDCKKVWLVLKNETHV